MSPRIPDDASARSAAAPLRILHVVPTYYPAVRYGGPIRSVHGLAAALAARGHEVHVATTCVDGPNDLEVPLNEPAMLDGVSVHYFGVPMLRRLYWSPAMRTWLHRHVADFDVVHLHSVFLWPTWAAARASRRAEVPYLLAPRGSLIGNLIRMKSRWLKTAWIELIERRTLRECAGVHVTAEIEETELRALDLPVPDLFTIPNGIGLPLHPSPLSDGPFASLPRPYALFLSRISQKKGLDRLIRAWKWVPDLTLVVAGNDEDDYQPHLRSLAAEQGVADRVRFVGPADDQHKWALYAEAELFALTSYSENFGNVVAEAMAMSCPVLVTEEVGLAPFVRAKGAGIVSGGDPREIAAAVQAIRADSSSRAEMGRRGRRAVIEHLSWDAIAAQMTSVYRQIGAGMPAAALA